MGFGSWRFKSSHPHGQIRPFLCPISAQTKGAATVGGAKKRPTDPVAVPLDFYSIDTLNVSGTTLSVDMSPEVLDARGGLGKLNVQMAERTVARGFLLALERLETTNRGQDAAIAIVELLNWLDSLAERSKDFAALQEVAVLRHLRDRCHHQLAFPIFRDKSGELRWLPWSQIPHTDRTRHTKPQLEAAYENEFAGHAVLDKIRPLEGMIRALIPEW